MKLLIAASLLLLPFAAGCQSETRVVHDDTVASKFAAFGKQGWGVSGGGLDQPRSDARPVGNLRYSSGGPTPFGPSDIQWTTNFKTDEPAAAPPPDPPSALDPNTGLPLAH